MGVPGIFLKKEPMTVLRNVDTGGKIRNRLKVKVKSSRFKTQFHTAPGRKTNPLDRAAARIQCTAPDGP